MKTIYRVENKKGNGCYRNLSDGLRVALDDVIDPYENLDDIQPSPEIDNGIMRSPHKNEICGFKNMDQVTDWFDSTELEILRRFGFEVKKVLVQKITAIGECQVLAVR